MGRFLLLAAFVAVGVGVFSWRFHRSDPRLRPLDEAPLAADSTLGSEPSSTPGTTTELPPRDPVEVPAGAQAATANAALPIEDRVPTIVEDAAFSARYAGWSRAQLDERIHALEPAWLAEVERLCDARFQAGQYRVVDAAEVEGLDDSYDVLSGFDPHGAVTRSRIVAREPSGQVPPEGEEIEADFEYQIVSLPPDVHPELYRQRAELDWLRATLAARIAAGEDPR